jgi:hypothetical protein
MRMKVIDPLNVNKMWRPFRGVATLYCQTLGSRQFFHIRDVDNYVGRILGESIIMTQTITNYRVSDVNK